MDLNSSWGEYLQCETQPSLHSSNRFKSYAISAIKRTDLSESNDDCTVTNFGITNISMNDPFVMNAILLHQHLNTLDYLLSVSKSEDTIIIPPLPKICSSEVYPHFDIFKQNESTPTDVSNVVTLEHNTSQELLMRSIAILLAHIGYVDCQEVALQTLLEVTIDFFHKLLTHLKKSTKVHLFKDRNIENPVNHTLTELGLNGIKGIHDYYQNRVVKYLSILKIRCHNLEQLLKSTVRPVPKTELPTMEKLVKVKVEEDAEDENTEVHFSTVDGEVNFSILEPGYQLLHSLEAETNLQNVDNCPQDISDQPSSSLSILDGPEQSSDQQITNSKKKRIKN